MIQERRMVIERGSELWPMALEDLQVPPARIYVLGDIRALDAQTVSVIGARRATPYGIVAAEMAGRVAAECGITVVSGGAMGCDHAASRSALDAGGKTVIVCGCGPDIVYPRSSADIFSDAVLQGGAIISPFPWGSAPKRGTFVQRNALIAALSPCLIVTEAGKRSGTMSTANTAAELDREILSVPGSIFSPYSSGTNFLIAEGAHPIVDERDLEAAIAYRYGHARLIAERGEQTATPLLAALLAQPTRPDELAERLGDDMLTMMRVLSELELQGQVRRLPDGRYAPSAEFLRSRCAS